MRNSPTTVPTLLLKREGIKICDVVKINDDPYQKIGFSNGVLISFKGGVMEILNRSPVISKQVVLCGNVKAFTMIEVITEPGCVSSLDYEGNIRRGHGCNLKLDKSLVKIACGKSEEEFAMPSKVSEGLRGALASAPMPTKRGGCCRIS